VNPWDALVLIMGWVFLSFVVLAGVLFLLGILLWIWQGMQKWVPALASKSKLSRAMRTEYMVQAGLASGDMYTNHGRYREDLETAFNDGASWGWHMHHRS